MSAVRIRSSAPDPFAGLRGHAYIRARGLTPKIGHMKALATVDDCQCTPCLQARLLPAVLNICRAQERRQLAQIAQTRWNDMADETTHDLLAAPLPVEA